MQAVLPFQGTDHSLYKLGFKEGTYYKSYKLGLSCLCLKKMRKQTRFVREACPGSPGLCPGVKNIINEQNQLKYPGQPNVNIPAWRIYSKVASRRRLSEQNVPDKNIDLSLCRSLKLQPPSWMNKPCQRKRQRPTQLDTIVKEMREKCAQFEFNSQCREEGMSSKMSDPKNHEPQYESCQITYNQEEPLVLQSGNPLEFCEESTEIKTIEHSLPQDLTPEFVWNPVIVKNRKHNELFTYLDNTPSSSNDSQEMQQARDVPDVHEISFYDCQIPQSNWMTPSSSSGSNFTEEGLTMNRPRRVPSPTMWTSQCSEEPWEEQHLTDSLWSSSRDVFDTTYELTISERSNNQFSYFTN